MILNRQQCKFCAINKVVSFRKFHDQPWVFERMNIPNKKEKEL